MSLDQPNAFVKHHSVTRDAFLGGKLTLSQPSKGFRAGLDSVLLGAAVGGGHRLLDLGCGVGTAAFVALVHHGGMEATLVDSDGEALQLASSNAADNRLAGRTQTISADVAAKGAQRRAAGLADNAYDTVIANPPYFIKGTGTLAGDQSRAGARHMDAAELDLWIKAAATSATAGGVIIFIFPSEGLAPLLSGFVQRFGSVTILPLCSRPGGPATRVLIRGRKGSRAPLTLLASRALHDAERRAFRPEFDAIFRGEARLDW